MTEVDGRRKGRHRRELSRQPEVRNFRIGSQVGELRSGFTQDSDGLVELNGQVIVYERSYDVYDMWGSFTETIHYGAAAPVLNGGNLDARFLFNHGGMPLDRTSANLQLNDSVEGLNVVARVDPDMSVANDLLIAIKRNLITQMSVGMEVDPNGDVWSGEDEYGMPNVRDIYRLANIFDASAVTYPASPTTSIDLAQRAWAGVPVESRERTRRLWSMARDGRAGRISQGESDVLLHALERLHDADDLVEPEPRYEAQRGQEPGVEAPETRTAPTDVDAQVTAAIAEAHQALQKALDLQATDPDNGTDANDKTVWSSLKSAVTALNGATDAQAKDSKADPSAATTKAADAAEPPETKDAGDTADDTDGTQSVDDDLRAAQLASEVELRARRRRFDF